MARASGTQGEPIASRVTAERTPAIDVGSSSGIAAAFAPDDDRKRPKEAFGLSKRELEVLALIADGRTNREIGERLFISQKTVGVHVGNILSKLGASGRVEAAMVAIRLELVPTPLAARPLSPENEQDPEEGPGPVRAAGLTGRKGPAGRDVVRLATASDEGRPRRGRWPRSASPQGRSSMPGGYGGSCLLTPHRLFGAPLCEGPKPRTAPCGVDATKVMRPNRTFGGSPGPPTSPDYRRPHRATQAAGQDRTGRRLSGAYRGAASHRTFGTLCPCHHESRPRTRMPTLARPRPAWSP